MVGRVGEDANFGDKRAEYAKPPQSNFNFSKGTVFRSNKQVGYLITSSHWDMSHRFLGARSLI